MDGIEAKIRTESSLNFTLFHLCEAGLLKSNFSTQVSEAALTSKHQ